MHILYCLEAFRKCGLFGSISKRRRVPDALEDGDFLIEINSIRTTKAYPGAQVDRCRGVGRNRRYDSIKHLIIRPKRT